MSEPSDGKSADRIRTFISIEIPGAIKARIESLQQRLRLQDAQISWTRPAGIHLTIKFLGDVRAARIESVREAVERAASSSAEFEIEVGGAGCFPSPRNPRVLWVGLTAVPVALNELHEAVESE